MLYKEGWLKVLSVVLLSDSTGRRFNCAIVAGNLKSSGGCKGALKEWCRVTTTHGYMVGDYIKRELQWTMYNLEKSAELQIHTSVHLNVHCSLTNTISFTYYSCLIVSCVVLLSSLWFIGSISYCYFCTHACGKQKSVLQTGYLSLVQQSAVYSFGTNAAKQD